MEKNDVTVTGNIPTSNIIIPEDIITKLRDEIIENLKSLFEKVLLKGIIVYINCRPELVNYKEELR